MAEQESVRVMVRNVAEAGQTYKIDAADELGNVRTYTMMKTDKQTGMQNTAPDLDGDYLFVYGTQTGEYQGKMQTTFWLNEVRMPQNPRPAPEPVQAGVAEAQAVSEIAEPKKGTSSFENPMNASIEWQVCIKEASANARANLEHAPQEYTEGGRVPITSEKVVAEARELFYGKEYPQHEEAEG